MKKHLLALALSLCILTYNSITCFALPIQTNEIPNWPVGPDVESEAAFLMEAKTGVILYAKNAHQHMYPASTTKIMTALLAAENSEMNEMVSFSHDAVFSLEPGSSSIGIDPGQSMPMEQCLYGIMVASANEVANAVGEHVGGSIEGFVDMMNDKVKELGLKDTHFMNTNGLFDEDHYTSAYDLAFIAREFFSNEKLQKIGNTPNYHFVATPTQPDDFYVRNKHKLINGDIPYEGIKGGKTGFVSESGETLVTCAENNGMKLICVVMNAPSPEQFYDTVKLFDYGFGNFQVTNIAENETNYSVKSVNTFPTSIDIIGNSKQLMEINKDNYIIMPKNISFSDLSADLDFEDISEGEIATINYSYHGAYLGKAAINSKGEEKKTLAFDESLDQTVVEEKIVVEQPTFINILKIASYVVAVTLVLIIISIIQSVLVNYNFLDNIREKRKTRRRRSRRDHGNLKF